MPRSPWLIAFALAALAALAPVQARAMGAVVGKQGEEVAVTTARIAVASTPSRTTRWAQVSVAGASTGFAWLVPVRAGARVDLASDAWLDALDAATAPVVLPPVAPDLCDAGVAIQRIAPGASPASTTPARSALFADEPSLSAFVTSAGYAIPPDLAARIEATLSTGGAILASTYDQSALPTRTLRIVDDGLPTLPLALTAGGASPAKITAFVLGSESASAGTSPLALDPSAVVWQGDGQSTYATARDTALAQWLGARWLTSSSLPDLLFDGAPQLPAVLAQYFALAQAYGDTTADPWACTADAYATRTSATSFVAECPAGALGVAPGPSACVPEDGGLPIDPIRCGAADDAVFALAALSPADVWVTRIEGIVTTTSASDVPVAISAMIPLSPVVTSAGYASTCDPPPAPPPPPPAQSPAEPSGPSATSGSSASDVAAPAAEGCGTALADSCSSSDSSSEDDSSGGCGSSSDPPSDGSSSSDSCGSGSSSTDDSSNSNCATSARVRVHGRSPVSRVLLALAAAAAVARRRRRGGR